jgi:hypothetical protein
MADGLYYVDSRQPFISFDVPSVTLATTDKALLSATNLPVLGANYFSYVGKAMRITLFGRITTAATPGNGTFSLYLGNGADANGTVLASSAALTLVASQSAIAWRAELIVRCRSLGLVATGSLFVTGQINFGQAVVAAGFGLIPASTPQSVAVDLTVASLLVPQFKRSGSTAETMQVHDVLYEALN